MAQDNGIMAHLFWKDADDFKQSADAFMRSTANNITFGLADGLAGTLNATLLSSASCKTISACINEELQKSQKALTEHSTASMLGLSAGIFLFPKVPWIKLPPQNSPANIEHAFALVGLSGAINFYLKPEFTKSGGVVQPDIPDAEITAPNVPNLVKELTGQRVLPPRR